MIGYCTIKVLSEIAVAKKCEKYDCSEQLNNEPEVHEYPHNHEGASKVMDAHSGLFFNKIWI